MHAAIPLSEKPDEAENETPCCATREHSSWYSHQWNTVLISHDATVLAAYLIRSYKLHSSLHLSYQSVRSRLRNRKPLSMECTCSTRHTESRMDSATAKEWELQQQQQQY